MIIDKCFPRSCYACKHRPLHSAEGGLELANDPKYQAALTEEMWLTETLMGLNAKFGIDLGAGELLATMNSDAYRQVDLLTVSMHELGHELGLGHADNYGLMAESLDTGAC